MNNTFDAKNYVELSVNNNPLMTVYGKVGVGKSTFASSFPDAFFFDYEGRTRHIKGIARDANYNLNIENLKTSWQEYLAIVRQLKVSSYKTIVFDGITKLEDFIWEHVGKQLNNPNPRSIPYGVGYAKAKELFSNLMRVAKELNSTGKTVIFIDHEIAKETSEVVNQTSYVRYQPTSNSGIFDILLKESDYIFRLCDDLLISETASGTKATFKDLVLLTCPKVSLDSVLKTSLPLPPKIKATYNDFSSAYMCAKDKLN